MSKKQAITRQKEFIRRIYREDRKWVAKRARVLFLNPSSSENIEEDLDFVAALVRTHKESTSLRTRQFSLGFIEKARAQRIQRSRPINGFVEFSVRIRTIDQPSSAGPI